MSGGLASLRAFCQRKELRGAPNARTLGHGLPGLCVDSSLMGVPITVLCNYYYESDAHLQRG